MSLRLFSAVGVSLTLLMTQAAWAFTPQVVFAPVRGASSSLILVQAQTDPTGAHWAIDAAKARLSEIDATITALEENARKLDGDARARADAVIQKLRASRDAYRAAIDSALANGRQMTEAQIADTRAALEQTWNEFETNVEGYFATVTSEVAARKAVFQARWEAEQLYWQKAIADLKESASTVAAEQRAAVEARIAELQTQANAAKARLAKLEQAGNDMWSALRDGLADARRVFDKTYSDIQTAIDRAKQ